MAWIESHDSIWEHHKTIKLCRALNISKAQAVGHLHGLWHFVLRNAWRDANLEAWGDVEIERACFWEGEKGVLVNELREVGFLDGFVVHGWVERAGRLVYDRIRKEDERLSAVKRRKKGGKSKATVPYPTQPYPTVPNTTKDKGTDAPKNGAEPTPSVSLPVVTANGNGAHKTQQAEFVDNFKASYESMTGQPFKADQKDFVIAAKLIKDHGLETVIEKTKILGVLCRDQTAWFTKDGWASFSIGKLSARWNEILPASTVTEEEKKKRAFLDSMQKEREKRAELNKSLERIGRI